MINAITESIHENIRNFVGDNQTTSYWGCWDAPTDGYENPIITISQCGNSRQADLRYARIKFRLEGIILVTSIHIYAKWLVDAFDPEFRIDLHDPTGFERLEFWILCESLDGLKRGWSGREEKKIPIIRRQKLEITPDYTQLELSFA